MIALQNVGWIEDKHKGKIEWVEGEFSVRFKSRYRGNKEMEKKKNF